ncbi:hypothetical protein C5B91_00705 [Haloferax sp. Atlit-10N]|uniref:helix-turn-helix transcriptional regulator n=1 Tax=Haloferax TaxID=2251 RepID=UPI000A057180|nr:MULTISPECIES: sigma factor-like helix-turn-helix DNA-binding protein [Haloferax]RDZ46231.1 hypothetical protein C5B87_00705 [Haloferax sp. Atlit-16N]RDZ60064.1 hypothetical protein C5B91_00705 [Haloferax sp. Atlit-10N]
MDLSEERRKEAEQITERTNLSKREAEVLLLKQAGTSSHADIADRLDLKRSTVDEYAKRIREKRDQSENTTRVLRDFSSSNDSLRSLIDRLQVDDKVVFTSTGRKSMKQPFTVVGFNQMSTTEGTKTRVEMDGPRGGKMRLLVEPNQDKLWQVYDDGKHKDNPVRWELTSLSIVAGESTIGLHSE